MGIPNYGYDDLCFDQVFQRLNVLTMKKLFNVLNKWAVVQFDEVDKHHTTTIFDHQEEHEVCLKIIC